MPFASTDAPHLPHDPPVNPESDHTMIAIELDPLAERISGVTVHGGMRFDAPCMTQVADNLWQGGCAPGLVLPPFIDHVVSLYPWERYAVGHELASFREVRMFDDATQPLDAVVPALAAWVNDCRRTGPTLVHCQAGLNRSGVVAAYALMLDGMSANDAIARIRQVRSSAVLCNPVFERWLRQPERLRDVVHGSDAAAQAVPDLMPHQPDDAQ
jgi:protein-tyrosine phosphatase